MQIEYTGRGTTVGIKERQMAETELRRMDEMVAGDSSAHVVLTEDKYRKIAEVTLKAAHESLVATCEGTVMLEALLAALKKVEVQAVKHKERKITVQRHGKPDSAEPLIEVPAVS